MTGHRLEPTILREYDIRGQVGKTLHAADAQAIGRAFAALVKEKGGRAVAVGYDGRLSSPKLEAALVEGLSGSGIDVVRVGLGPTPMLYFAASTLGVDGGIMITGSHNPPDYNGFKMMLGKKSVFGEEIQKLGRIAAEGRFPRGQGRVGEKRRITPIRPRPRTSSSSRRWSQRRSATSASRSMATATASAWSTARVASSGATS
jgi:phosphomannomutase